MSKTYREQVEELRGGQGPVQLGDRLGEARARRSPALPYLVDRLELAPDLGGLLVSRRSRQDAVGEFFSRKLSMLKCGNGTARRTCSRSASRSMGLIIMGSLSPQAFNARFHWLLTCCPKRSARSVNSDTNRPNVRSAA